MQVMSVKKAGKMPVRSCKRLSETSSSTQMDPVKNGRMTLRPYKRLTESTSKRNSKAIRKTMEALIGGGGGRPPITNEPELPISKEKIRYTHKNPIKKDKTMLYILGDHIIDLFDQSLKQCNATELRYKRLDQTTKTALFMQTRDHQNTIDKLNEKVKILEEKNKHRTELYKDHSNGDEHHHDNDDEDAEPIARIEKYEREIGILHMQLSACEQSTHKTVSHYATELEKERLESRKLTSIIEKQQNTITLLENQLKETQIIFRTSSSSRKPEGHGSHDLIKALVDLQSMELDDKKHLLANLVNEREILLQKIDELNNPSLVTVNKKKKLTSHQDRSSIDLLAQITSTNLVQDEPTPSTLSPGTVLHYFSTTPPPTPPPTCALPLPPPENKLELSTMLPIKNNPEIITSLIQPLSSTENQSAESFDCNHPPSSLGCHPRNSNSSLNVITESNPEILKKFNGPTSSHEDQPKASTSSFMRPVSPPAEENSKIKPITEKGWFKSGLSDIQYNSASLSSNMSPRTSYLMRKKKKKTD